MNSLAHMDVSPAGRTVADWRVDASAPELSQASGARHGLLPAGIGVEEVTPITGSVSSWRDSDGGAQMGTASSTPAF